MILSRRPRIAVTMGDPCGIGPEILVKALARGALWEECAPIVIGDANAFERAARELGIELDFRLTEEASSLPQDAGWTPVLTPGESLAPEDLVHGSPTEKTCRAVLSYIETAARMAMEGRADALCTCPIHKANLHRHGFAFPGHTEFLQRLTGSQKVVMMLAGPRLKVSLATIHCALAEVPGLLTPERLRETIAVTGEALVRDFGMDSPHVAVAGLNPHAGEEGRFGHEEVRVLGPVVESFAGRDYRVTGPYPSDTLFHRAFTGEFDAVVAMYHDQGLIPVKLVHFEEAVNVSLGLPVVRTSVDHGTAYDLAGTGRARETSLVAAIRLAAYMSRRRACRINRR